MTETIRCALLALVLAVAALPAPLWAQQDEKPTATESSEEAVKTPEETQSEPDASPPESAEDPPSPFDYEASEEISEDLSVSFPVDI
ncbi:MAG: hypothetical protein U5K56_08875 [Halioglobus sp.]|nr:hypothetical protein [Halioglobus sp.]